MRRGINLLPINLQSSKVSRKIRKLAGVSLGEQDAPGSREFATSFFRATSRVTRTRAEASPQERARAPPDKRNFEIVSLGAQIKFSFVRVMESARVPASRFSPGWLAGWTRSPAAFTRANN